MKYLLFAIGSLLILVSCNEEEQATPRAVPVEFKILPHTSDNEFFISIPVEVIVQPKISTFPFFDIVRADIYVDGTAITTTPLIFQEARTYTLKALVTMIDESRYEIDTTLTVTLGPQPIGTSQKGEDLLFGWKVGNRFKFLQRSYNGSSVYDYDVLSVDQSLKPDAPLKRMNFGWYPSIRSHAITSSGRLTMIYDDMVVIYNEALTQEHTLYFANGHAPQKVWWDQSTGEHAMLLFDSLDHIRLKPLSMTTGKLGSSSVPQNLGVAGMDYYERFFLDKDRIATYFAEPGNAKTLLMGFHIAEGLQFSQYFLPPIFIRNVSALSTGGYIITSYISDQNKLKILGADQSNVVKWTREFPINFRNYWFELAGNQIEVTQLGDFIYIFFDNFRCIKISRDGLIVWDKYFYATTATLNDVVVTDNGEFVMAGTRLGYSENGPDFQYRKDVLLIRINANGERL